MNDLLDLKGELTQPRLLAVPARYWIKYFCSSCYISCSCPNNIQDQQDCWQPSHWIFDYRKLGDSDCFPRRWFKPAQGQKLLRQLVLRL
jgi:hypothetical protein